MTNTDAEEPPYKEITDKSLGKIRASLAPGLDRKASTNVIHDSEIAKQQGNEHYKQGDYLEAIQKYNLSMQLWFNPNTLNNRSMACNSDFA